MVIPEQNLRMPRSQRFPNGGLRTVTWSRMQTPGSPEYLYLIFNFIIMSRVSSYQETASRFLFINYWSFWFIYIFVEVNVFTYLINVWKLYIDIHKMFYVTNRPVLKGDNNLSGFRMRSIKIMGSLKKCLVNADIDYWKMIQPFGPQCMDSNQRSG